MGYEDGRAISASAETVRSATEQSLILCDRLGLESVAFPALGTGVGGLDMATCARVMVGTVARYLFGGQNHLRAVVFVLRNENARQIFEEAIEQGGAVV